MIPDTALPDLEAFEINTAHTLAVVRAVPDAGWWDRGPAPGVKTLRQQLAHLALVRESIARCLAGEPTAGLGAAFEGPAWERGGTAELAEAFEAHAARCRPLLARLAPAGLDAPFTTAFGTPSTPRNYLRFLLIEEVHHRAQMTQLIRLFGGEPPAFPGERWAAVGLA